MTIKTRIFPNIITLLISMMILAACGTPETIQVIITPTPDPNAPTTTPTPTLIPPTNTETPIPTATHTLETTQPTNTTSPTETETLIPPTATATPTTTVTPENLPPSPTFLGPVIRGDYVLPTIPPPPTATDQLDDLLAPRPTTEVSVTPGPSTTPYPGLDASQMGLQMYSNLTFNDWMLAVSRAEVTNVEWIKIQVNWDFLQPTAPNEFNESIQLFEQQIEGAARPGFKILLSIAKAPDWARSNLMEDGPPDDPQALADFITFLLTETKIGETIDAIEVWNEPNLAREWRGVLPFNGEGYMQLFRPAYDAIRAYSPDMPIITAGLAPTSNLGEAIDDRDFLQQMYNAGLANYTDIAIGVHPYGWGNPPDSRCCDPIPDRGWDEDPHFFFIQNIEDIYAVMQRNGHGNLQMWATEFGWSSWIGFPTEPPEEWHIYTTPQQQAEYVLRAFEIGQSLDYMGPMFLWNLNFANDGTIAQEIAGFSIFNPVISPAERPLYWALNAALADQE